MNVMELAFSKAVIRKVSKSTRDSGVTIGKALKSVNV